MPILRLARSSFDPDTLAAMSKAFEEACAALNVVDEQGREAVAILIIDFARGGTIDAESLRDRVIRKSQAAAVESEMSAGDSDAAA
jgi:hypothetical protein